METLFLDYENCLINLQKDIGIYNFYNAEPGGANQQKALSCIRYAIEEYPAMGCGGSGLEI